MLGSYGRTFPHEFTTPEDPYFSTFLTISPVGDQNNYGSRENRYRRGRTGR